MSASSFSSNSEDTYVTHPDIFADENVPPAREPEQRHQQPGEGSPVMLEDLEFPELENDEFSQQVASIFISYEIWHRTMTEAVAFNRRIDGQDPNTVLFELPPLFHRFPVDDRGYRRRQPRMQDIAIALRALAEAHANPDASPDEIDAQGRQYQDFVESCALAAVKLMRSLSPIRLSILSFHRYPSQIAKDLAMTYFMDMVHMYKPKIRIDACSDNWMAVFLFTKCWNSFAAKLRKQFPLPQPHHRYNTRNHPSRRANLEGSTTDTEEWELTPAQETRPRRYNPYPTHL